MYATTWLGCFQIPRSSSTFFSSCVRRRWYGHNLVSSNKCSGRATQDSSRGDRPLIPNGLLKLMLVSSFSSLLLGIIRLMHCLVPCSQYLCPDTLVCVSNPSDCPCPSVEDIKCLIPDAEDRESATVTCVRGAHDCSEVERLYKRFA